MAIEEQAIESSVDSTIENTDATQIAVENPATGEVIAQYSATVFAALARSVGITGAPVVDEHA